QQMDVDVAEQGAAALGDIKVFTATAHSSTVKALAMLGLGRRCVQSIACLNQREAVDIDVLEQQLSLLEHSTSLPAVVVASAGTVNTADFDDLQALCELKSKYHFWLHVDGAFGAFAACSPRHAHLVASIEHADSITVDCHKWLNVPYDSALQFSRHQQLQLQVFQNYAVYLGTPTMDEPNFVHLTPENSRRFRALPTWMTLMAYGKQGYREIVERNCELAQLLTERLSQSPRFDLLAPTHLNVVCFALRRDSVTATMEETKSYLDRVRTDGKVFLTPTTYQNTAAIRAAICNWSTEAHDIDVTVHALHRCLA
ncbi:MAG: pyridoxal-dependent decarboxylase, partial [Gammaproteobacteria bacterium]|nr:pyridoxal-dependent decarboxylase [Gammaproteobacteria bacterium]